MFNKLNKKLTNKQFLVLVSQRMGCLNARSISDTNNTSKNDSKHKKVDKNVDYLGIFDINQKEISGLYDNTDQQIDVFDRYKDLMDSRHSQVNEQKYLITTFGRVRLDSDNCPNYHGQYDPHNTRLKFDINQFNDKLKHIRKMSDQNEKMIKHNDQISTNSENNIFEEQYFDKLRDTEDKRNDLSSNNSCSTDPQSSELGLIDRQYFASNPNIDPIFKNKINFKFSDDFSTFIEQKSSESVQRFNPKTRDSNITEDLESNELNDNFDDSLLSKRIEFKSPLKSELFSQNFVQKYTETHNRTDEEIAQKIEEQKDIKLETIESNANKYKKTQRTGAQYLEDLQSGKETPKYPKLFTQEVKEFRSVLSLKQEKLDSKGYRILSGQVLDYSRMTREDILSLLIKSILFDDSDILAINKPYGMSIHSREANISPVLTEYLPQLSENVETEKLYTVHRLDRDTTGVLLLAKSQEKAKQLNKMFMEHKIVKRYLCITRGVPDQREGIIDIPIEIGKCDNKERMVLRPEALEEYKTISNPSKTAKRAVTQYKVMSESNNSALIEVWPQTGIRHQIRVHLGFGLRCPILGDHKYSHLDRIAPQKLTNDMLLALNVRQSKVRHIPLHLHAMQYCLPGAGLEGRNIFINAPFPHHFHKNMSRLRLRQ